MNRQPDHDRLQAAAKRHLWMHFTRMSSYADHEVPVMVRGEGPWVYDSKGKRYLDGLSGLFVVQAGHGRQELADAASRQASQLAYFPLWSYAHPNAIELAERLANLAPGDLNRVFFTTGGGEAVETAWKMARQYFNVTGQPGRYKVLSREIAYHGTTMGALSITGLPAIKSMYEPLVPGSVRVANTNFYRAPEYGDDIEAFGQWAARDIERRIEMEGPETVAAVFLEPVQNSGGCFPPPPGYFQEVRRICDKYGVLMVSDEVICAFGRLGEWFGAIKYDFEPDIMTTAKGLTSAYQPLGAVMISDKVAEPFLAGGDWMHGITFGGHPVATAVALRNIEILEREDILGNVRRNEGYFHEQLVALQQRHAIIGDVRGTGYFKSLELVKDKHTRETFSAEECDVLLRGFLSEALFSGGLICRADDRGDPVIQLSPPLIAGRPEIDEAIAVLDDVLPRAEKRMQIG
jgi:adenosylmethionine-8-amino-7-oxononanoate aminotransferase